MHQWALQLMQSLPERSAPCRIDVCDRLAPVLESDISAAIVANMPAQHFETARSLLQSGKHVLVEKPFVRNLENADRLIKIAREKNCVCAIGHEFLFAPYLHRYKAYAQYFLPEVDAVHIDWKDPWRETRWNQEKLWDLSITVAADLMPHILSILGVLFGLRHPSRIKARTKDGGQNAHVTLAYPERTISVCLSRTAKTRRRSIMLHSRRGDTLEIDFSCEPAILRYNNKALAIQRERDKTASSLDLELDAFFAEIKNRNGALANSAENLIEDIKICDKIERQIYFQQIRCIIGLLKNTGSPSSHAFALNSMREHMCMPFLECGLLKNPKDHAALESLSQKALDALCCMSQSPFSGIREISRRTELSAPSARKLMKALEASLFSNTIIYKIGPSNKYWQNTLLPAIRSGHIHAALHGRYAFPRHIGIYPGLSCMFHCSFCGRNPRGCFKAHETRHSLGMFARLFAEAPQTDPKRFYISGGVEPLTNPDIGAIAQAGADYGFSMCLYTNGYLLNSSMLARHPGLFSLSAIRISLYGVDEGTTAATTGRAKAFSRVIENAIAFLRTRRGPIRLGFNYVALRNRESELLRLVDILEYIQREARTERGIDFLTIREDFTAYGDNGITGAHRHELSEILIELQNRIRKGPLHRMKIDLGYALQPIARRFYAQQLSMVTSAHMRPRAFTQISVAVDARGDVYLYREAGFPQRKGALRYRIGTLSPTQTLENIVRQFVESKAQIIPQSGDALFLDIFDHVITRYLDTLESDEALLANHAAHTAGRRYLLRAKNAPALPAPAMTFNPASMPRTAQLQR
jgi:dTDP-4-amino-4,6-dideoxy-D-glucose ammonia-lyase